MHVCVLWNLRKISCSVEEIGQAGNECKMCMCCLVYMHIGYLQFGKTTGSSIIIFFNKSLKELKVLSNANISAAVSITHYGGHGETLSREMLV